jgi:hypothetical protein
MEDVVEDASELTLLDMLPPVVAAPVPCEESVTGMIRGMLEGVLLLDIMLMTLLLLLLLLLEEEEEEEEEEEVAAVVVLLKMVM